MMNKRMSNDIRIEIRELGITSAMENREATIKDFQGHMYRARTEEC